MPAFNKIAKKKFSKYTKFQGIVVKRKFQFSKPWWIKLQGKNCFNFSTFRIFTISESKSTLAFSSSTRCKNIFRKDLGQTKTKALRFEMRLEADFHMIFFHFQSIDNFPSLYAFSHAPRRNQNFPLITREIRTIRAQRL